MLPEQYQKFTNELTQTLESDDRVLGLVALGSMASETYRDQWSDHDFWIITISGAQEAFLDDLSWLPDHKDIVIALRPAAQYYTVLYRAGHIAEFAVFDEQQLAQGKLNNYRLLFDKQDIDQHIRLTYEKTIEQQPAGDAVFEFGNFMVYLWVGLTRYWRGETLSSHKYLTQYALDALLSLVVKHVPPRGEGILDNLDARRRFELAYPDLSEALNMWPADDAPHLATRLLDVAERALREVLPNYPHQAVVELYRHIKMNQTVTVDFASKDDEAWLFDNDASLARNIIQAKIERREYIIAKGDERYLGFLRLSYLWSFIPFIEVIAVEDVYQRQGVGKKMVSLLEEFARQQGQQLIMSSSDDAGAQEWHRRIGFEQAGAITDFEPIQKDPEIIFIKRLSINGQ